MRPTFVGNSFPIICMILPAVRRTANSGVLLNANGAKRARDLQYEGCRGLCISAFEKNAGWFRRRDGHLLTIHETDFSVYRCQGHRFVSWSSRNRFQQAKCLCSRRRLAWAWVFSPYGGDKGRYFPVKRAHGPPNNSNKIAK